MFDAHANAIYAYVARRLGRDVAQDVVADVFAIALDRFHTFSPLKGTERGWLYGIANNRLRRHWRTERRRLRALARSSRVAERDVEPTSRVDDGVDAQRSAALVVAAIERLGPADRDLLAMYAWERCSYREIAAALNIPLGTVGTRIARVRTLLRADLLEGEVG